MTKPLKYEDIPSFAERCEFHPDHQTGMISESMLKQRLHEEINELREYIEQRKWVGLTDEEIDQGLLRTKYAMQTAGAWRDGVEWAIKQFKEKNT